MKCCFVSQQATLKINKHKSNIIRKSRNTDLCSSSSVCQTQNGTETDCGPFNCRGFWFSRKLCTRNKERQPSKGNVEVSATCSARDFHRFVAESLWISEQCAFKDDILTTGNSPDSSSDSPLTTLLFSM